MKNISDIALGNPRSCYPLDQWDKTFILEMFEKFGKEETLKRWSFHLELSIEETSILIENYLTDNWVDEENTAGGHCFYGDL